MLAVANLRERGTGAEELLDIHAIPKRRLHLRLDEINAGINIRGNGCLGDRGGFSPNVVLCLSFQIATLKAKLLPAMKLDVMWNGYVNKDMYQVVEAAVPLVLQEVFFEYVVPTERARKLVIHLKYVPK